MVRTENLEHIHARLTPISSRVYGGYRKTLGPYEVIVDGSDTTQQFMGYSVGDAEQADALLFHQGNLKDGNHHLEIANISRDKSRPVLDINRVSDLKMRTYVIRSHASLGHISEQRL